MYWFTSDTHFGHYNILAHDGRPFQTIESHDAYLIAMWNAVVGKGDVVYHLGDFAWSQKAQQIDEILSQLNGTKILIRGNHDGAAVRKSPHWAKVTPYEEIVYQPTGQRICLFHYRMVVWNQSHRGSWALHGHSHGTLPEDLSKNTFDVGTMCWNYTPINIHMVAKEMSKHRVTVVDHHGKARLYGTYS